MRALTISAHGGLDQLEYRDDLPAPELREPTDVRVRVEAAALNHLDLFVLGGLPNVRLAPPFVVSDGELDLIVERLQAALDAALSAIGARERRALATHS